jgi:hypothetical protein
VVRNGFFIRIRPKIFFMNLSIVIDIQNISLISFFNIITRLYQLWSWKVSSLYKISLTNNKSIKPKFLQFVWSFVDIFDQKLVCCPLRSYKGCCPLPSIVRKHFSNFYQNFQGFCPLPLYVRQNHICLLCVCKLLLYWVTGFSSSASLYNWKFSLEPCSSDFIYELFSKLWNKEI